MEMYSVEVLKIGSDERLYWCGGAGNNCSDVMVKLSLDEVKEIVNGDVFGGGLEDMDEGQEIRICKLVGGVK